MNTDDTRASHLDQPVQIIQEPAEETLRKALWEICRLRSDLAWIAGFTSMKHLQPAILDNAVDIIADVHLAAEKALDRPSIICSPTVILKTGGK